MRDAFEGDRPFLGRLHCRSFVRGVFASVNFFLFYGGAKLGRFRLTSSQQVVGGPWVREWRWGDIHSISPRGWDKILRGCFVFGGYGAEKGGWKLEVGCGMGRGMENDECPNDEFQIAIERSPGPSTGLRTGKASMRSILTDRSLEFSNYFWPCRCQSFCFAGPVDVKCESVCRTRIRR
jgi:hypothetical protein